MKARRFSRVSYFSYQPRVYIRTWCCRSSATLTFFSFTALPKIFFWDKRNYLCVLHSDKSEKIEIKIKIKVCGFLHYFHCHRNQFFSGVDRQLVSSREETMITRIFLVTQVQRKEKTKGRERKRQRFYLEGCEYFI